MRRILSLIRQDIVLAMRDNIVLYIIIGPVMLALALRLFLPQVGDIKLTFAVDKNVADEYVSELYKYGIVELYTDRGEVEQRVEKNDAICGVVPGNGSFKMLFEGNEPNSVIESYKTVLDKVAGGGNYIDFSAQSLGTKGSLLYEILTIMILMTTLFLGGAVSGFNIVNEKDTKTLRSLAVSPLKFYELIMARGLIAVTISTIVVFAVSLIVAGITVNYWRLFMTLMLSSTLTTAVCMVVGRMANNQINAISSIKTVMPVYLTLPLASLFIPERFQLFLYPLPGYWQFLAFRNIYSSAAVVHDFWISAVMTFVTGTILLIILAKVFKRHFGIR